MMMPIKDHHSMGKLSLRFNCFLNNLVQNTLNILIILS